MRLISIFTGELKWFTEENIKPYAILSHRWLEDKDEVTFEEYSDPVRLDQTKKGFSKIEHFRQFVRRYNHHLEDLKRRGEERGLDQVEWMWIDTCCIDKRSSTELSESINSMARWYRAAAYCVAFLADVDIEGDRVVNKGSIGVSSWFTRGWCLQELLFPSEIIFCNESSAGRGWNVIGKKTDPDMRGILRAITGIQERCLIDLDYMLRQCVARKMSWVSRRKTKRVEDMAYCLLGLFNIHMPLLYGEGGNAFMRLQEEIVRQTDDESIFAWSLPQRELFPYGEGPLVSCASVLAPHPVCFAGQGGSHLVGLAKRRPYRMTNKGLEMESQFVEVHYPPFRQKVTIVELNCGRGRGQSSSRDKSCLMALGDAGIGRYERLQPNPRVLGPDSVWDEVFWKCLSSEEAKISEIQGGALYIKATGTAASVGNLDYNNTESMRDFMDLRWALERRHRRERASQQLEERVRRERDR